MESDLDSLLQITTIYSIDSNEGACHARAMTPRQAFAIVEISKTLSLQMRACAAEIRSSGLVQAGVYRIRFGIPLEVFQEIIRMNDKNGVADWFIEMANCVSDISRSVKYGFPPTDLASCFACELALHIIVVRLFHNPDYLPAEPVHPCDYHTENLYNLLLGEGALVESWLLPRLFEERTRAPFQVADDDDRFNIDLPPISAWFIPYKR